VYYWDLISETEGSKVYSYHLKNISDKTIKFYNFTLTNNGGNYYLVDNLLLKPVFAAPGESIQMVKYQLNSGEAPSVNWYADWTSFSSSSDSFCSGLKKILEASKDGFSSIKGEIKESAEDGITFFDSYYCKEHIENANNEVIEDMIFYLQYSCTLGTLAEQNVINRRFYDYKSKIESCLPDFPERKAEKEEDDSANSNLKIEYEAEVNYTIHYIKLEVVKDYTSDNYFLELIVEEAY
jgi:hypothetical protein